MSLVHINYTLQVPGGDMSDRFGINNAIGLGYSFKFKSNWEVGLAYNFMFGNNVKDTGMLNELRGESGGVINENGTFSNFKIFERGHHVMIKGGKILPFFSPNPNSGFYVEGGLGFIVHKVRIFNQDGDIPQFNAQEKAYTPGYDRYTSGVTLSEYIGYRYLSNNSLINFHIGVEFIQGFTKLRRDYQVDYPVDFESKTRKDFLFGIKAGWILPIYKRPAKDFYY